MKRIIASSLEEIKKNIKVTACMPGHKGKISITGSDDVTELPGLDNLSAPSGIIKESQEMAAGVYGVKHAFYLVNGSTGGNLTMIYSNLMEGDRVLFERNCHKSIYSALNIRRAKPSFLMGTGGGKPVSFEEIKEKTERYKDIKAVIITSPSYTGYTADLSRIHPYLKERGILLLCDGAHGAHLIGFPEYRDIYRHCDAVVVSLHKTMGAVNQTALLLTDSDEVGERLKEYIPYFQTSSPSYVLLKSIEDAVAGILEKNSPRIREEFLSKYFGNGFKNMDVYGEDPWKINISSGSGGKYMNDYLTKRGIYPEFYTGDSLLLMLSPYNTEDELSYLAHVLTIMDSEVTPVSEKDKDIVFESEVLPFKKMEMWEALQSAGSYMDVEEGLGRIAKDFIIPYPPGVPLLVPGEVMDEGIMDNILRYMGENREIIGIKNGRMRFI